ncbi:unnamed protein product [Leptidea sinapis]|uniref:Uncharacterized protein n=1 Tax=Leptidea sinapis TaxID=189913 RepID=A0A5E4R401_9NEOP|nr:unnamed protein product [Leptidea sinapis]
MPRCICFYNKIPENVQNKSITLFKRIVTKLLTVASYAGKGLQTTLVRLRLSQLNIIPTIWMCGGPPQCGLQGAFSHVLQSCGMSFVVRCFRDDTTWVPSKKAQIVGGGDHLTIVDPYARLSSYSIKKNANEEICRRTKVTDIAQMIAKLKWHKVLEWRPRTGRRSVGMPPTRRTGYLVKIAGIHRPSWKSLGENFVQQWTSSG